MQVTDAERCDKDGRRCMRVLAHFRESRRSLLQDGCFLPEVVQEHAEDRPRLIRPVESHNALICTDEGYERKNREWPCGLGGVLVTQNGGKIFLFLMC